MAAAEAALEAHVVEEAEEAGDDFESIDNLQKMGISAADIKKAKEGGVYTAQALLMVPKRHLAEIKGLSEAKVDKMVELARKLVPSAGWRTAGEAAQARAKEIIKIKTGATAVDELLGGGFETKSLTELHGEWRCGKTVMAHTLCVTTQLPQEEGGGAGKAAFIDTEGTFRPEVVKQIAERFGLDPEAVLGNIVVARAHTSDAIADLLIPLTALMAEEACFRLLVVDSLTSTFRTDYTGRGELAERQQKLNNLLARIKKMSEEFNVAVVVTNQVVSDPGGGAMFVSDPKKPVGGHVVAHACTTRLSLRKGKGEQRLIKVVASPCLAEAEASFQCSGQGVVDHKD
ncbi:hypothetical protein HYH03_014252 [Edaphochlamys debaryana]|uniref:Uncharacterized protein n=1 Tax=Edaphochlamys debaryana TaxID=47281 RepID=A0A835XP52_9CHLO|nr:hypothetical protein HYH03_014252 [Edaphochlamys debaryana]|eukprot:KAG2487139.1 hypothetical protein HYH03_014252 [Edaphochlamys debaryana]